MGELFRRPFGRLFGAAMLLGISLSAHAAPTDSDGSVPDAQVICVPPEYHPTVYTTCLETGHLNTETVSANCKTLISMQGLFCDANQHVGQYATLDLRLRGVPAGVKEHPDAQMLAGLVEEAPRYSRTLF